MWRSDANMPLLRVPAVSPAPGAAATEKEEQPHGQQRGCKECHRQTLEERMSSPAGHGK